MKRPLVHVAVVLAVVAAGCGSGGGDHARTTTPTGQDGRSPDTGTSGLIDVGGYELAFECRGEGSPTIVTEAGYDSAGTSTWAGLMDDLAAISRVCSYDRAGTGASDGRPDAHGLTSADEADELHALLVGAGIDPPYVLVAHSYGGFIARLFADAHLDETAGLVLVESSHEDEIEPYRAYYGDDPEGDWVDGGDLIDIDATERALRHARDYGAIPLIAIRAERYEDVLDEDLWIRTQADLATLSSNSIHVVALHSGHFVMDPGNNPDVVIGAVDAVVEAARTGDRLSPCDEVFGELDARCP